MQYDDKKGARPRVEIDGDIGLVSQKVWILNDTVRENILFGKRYLEEKYKECIKYACLERDMATLTFGDLTQIGDKGANLSGG